MEATLIKIERSKSLDAIGIHTFTTSFVKTKDNSELIQLGLDWSSRLNAIFGPGSGGMFDFSTLDEENPIWQVRCESEETNVRHVELSNGSGKPGMMGQFYRHSLTVHVREPYVVQFKLAFAEEFAS